MPTATTTTCEFSTNSQILGHVLRLLKDVVSKKATIPILNNILLRAEGDTVHLFVTDLEVSLSTSCPALVSIPGEMTLPALKLAAMIEQLPDVQVSLVQDGSHARLTAGKFTSRLQTQDAEDFPRLPLPEGDAILIPGDVLRQMSRRTRYATKDSDPRYQLNGVLLDCTETYVRMVATDGSRMAMATLPRNGGAPLTAMLLPAALKILEGLSGDGVVQCLKQENTISFQVGPHRLSTRVIDGQFPNYEQIIPTGNTHVATINRAALIAALRRVGLASGRQQTTVFVVNDTALTLTSTSAEIGEAQEELPAEYAGPPIRICLSWRFLLDFLETATGDTITLALKDPLTQVLLKDGTEFVGVVMPWSE